MSINYFLYGYLTTTQIKTINKLKQNDNQPSDKTINGNANSLAEDLTSYNNNENIQVNNADIFKYIEKTYGMNNFQVMLDANGDGKLYVCPIVSNIKYFNKRFNKNLQVSKGDYIDLYEISQIEDIIKWQNSPKPFCKYCTPLTLRPWESSIEHKIDEWT